MDLYYYQDSKRLGPVNADQLRALALQGIITPETKIEAGNKKLPARKVKGLVFDSPGTEPPVVPPPVEQEPEPQQELPTVESVVESEQDLTVSPDWSTHIFKSIGFQVEKTGTQQVAEHRRKARSEAATSLADCCFFLNGAAWFIFLVNLVGGIIMITNATESKYPHDTNPMLIAAGIGSIVSGIITVIISSFFTALGRYLIARDDAS